MLIKTAARYKLNTMVQLNPNNNNNIHAITRQYNKVLQEKQLKDNSHPAF